jgi:DNA-binding response OmpR family regulator
VASVLVIDDDRTFCETLGESLAQAGHEVRTAYDGAAGVAEFAREPADVVILDVIMPGKMEGVETMIELGDLKPGVPVVVISGGGTGEPEGYLSSAKALGAAATLAKPFDRAALLAVIADLTARASGA